MISILWSLKSSLMYSAHLCRILYFSQMMSLFLSLGHPVDEHVFFPEILSMLLYIVCSVLLQYSLMFLHLFPLLFGFITFFSDFLMQIFVFLSIIFYLPPFSHEVQNAFSHSLLFCFPLDSWYLFHCCFCDRYFELCPFFFPLPQTSNLFGIATHYFFEGCSWILITSGQVWCF